MKTEGNNTWLWYLAIFLLISSGFRALPFIILAFIGYKIYQVVKTGQSFNQFVKNAQEKVVSMKKNTDGSFSPKNKPSFDNFNFSPPKMKTSYIIGVILALGLFLLIADGFVSVPAGHTAVIFDKGRGILKNPLPEGLHLKIPFWQESQIYATRKQEFTMAGNYAGIKDEDAVQGRSSDGQNVSVDITVIYQIEAKDTPYLRGEFLTEEGYRTTIVHPSARSIVYDSISKFNAIDLVSVKRGDFRDMIFEKLEESYKNNNIILHDILVRNVTFSQEFSDAIERKQIAEQDIKTAENRKKEAEQVAEKRIIEAGAEAKSIELKGSALRDNPQVIQLEFVNKMSPNISWGILPDGALPLIDINSLKNQ